MPLQFSAYKRSRQTSAMVAVQYGPSAKRDGLGLLEGTNGVWVPTDRGRQLAQALDALLSGSHAYPLFCRVAVPERMERAAAEELGLRGFALRIPDDPRPELGAYVKALFRLEVKPSVTRDRRPLRRRRR